MQTEVTKIQELWLSICDIFWLADRLDGLAKRRKTEDKPQTLEDWLQLTDDYDRRKTTPGKKMVKYCKSFEIMYLVYWGDTFMHFLG
jgi:hypothetical protein